VKQSEVIELAGETEFEKLFLPHLDAAYNLAYLLMRNSEDAADVVQEAYLKALRAYASFRGQSGRPWLLAIVRNTAFTWLRTNRLRMDHAEFNEDVHTTSQKSLSPESAALGREREFKLEHCIDQLPSDFRETIILRELEDLSYSDIAVITGVPRGTVMSRLARARSRLATCLKCSEVAATAVNQGRVR
jgi:RNA polymerase sigma-70 factor (ECF subfamily)